MKDDNKTKKQLIDELMELRLQNAVQKKSITGSISAEVMAEEARCYAESIVETVRDPLLVLDADLKIISATHNFYRTFKVTPDETIGSFIYDLGNKQWNIPKLRELLEEVLPEKEAFDDFEVAHTFQNIGHKVMLLNARQIYRKDFGTQLILLAIEDITERKRSEEVIKNNMVFQQVLTDAVPSPIFYKDAACVYIGGNKAFERYLGLSPEQFIGKTVYDISPANLAEKYDEADRELLNNPGIQTYEASVVYADGTRHNVVFNKSTFTNAEGKIAGLLGVILDITERNRAEESLRESERKFKEMAQTIPLAIYLSVGVEQKCEYLNPMFIKLFGYTLEDIPTVKQWWPLAYPDENYSRQISEEWTTKVQRAIETQSPIEPMEVVVTCKDGSKKNISWGYITIGDKNYAYGLDLTERKQAEEKIQQMAYHDTLTGLPNRKLFSDRLGIALAQSQRNQKKGGDAMLDLDKFKDVNDTLGHDVGDLLLKASAERLSAELRKGDTVARFGGDEFALSFPDLKEREDMIQIAQKIVDSFHMPFLIGTHQLSVTASIGIAVYPQDGTDEDILLKNADIAMYQAKQTGRDRYKLYKKA